MGHLSPAADAGEVTSFAGVAPGTKARQMVGAQLCAGVLDFRHGPLDEPSIHQLPVHAPVVQVVDFDELGAGAGDDLQVAVQRVDRRADAAVRPLRDLPAAEWDHSAGRVPVAAEGLQTGGVSGCDFG